MKRTWLYFNNTFEINTRRVPGKALKIGNDHDSRLNGDKSDPDILALWNVFNPLLLVFRTLFTVWKSSISLRMSKTLTMNKQFKLLADEWIKQWEGKVHYFFPEGSPEDMAIFPDRRSPFQSENYELRIQAVSTLSESMKPYADLKDTQKDVETKYQILLKVRDDQKQAMQTVEKNSQQLEAQRKLLSKQLFVNLATLMIKYADDPTQGERFFNESLIRRPSSETDSTFNQSGKVNAGSSMVIALPKKLEMSINATFNIANSEGGAELLFFFADTASAMDSPQKAVVPTGNTVEAKAGEMGWGAANIMLLVKNTGTLTAEYELTLTEATE